MTAHLEDFGLGVDDYGVDAPLDHQPAATPAPKRTRASASKELERPRLAGPARYGLIFLVTCLVLGLVGSTFLAFFSRSQDPTETAEAAPAPVSQPQPPAAAEANPAPTAAPPTTADDITAVTWQGYSMPVSASAGPHQLTDTRASGFAHTPVGAALAALHISVRMAPMTGPNVFRPTITQQVVGHDTSKQLAAVNAQYQQLAKVAGVSGGRPVIGATPPFTGYRVRDYTDNAATVDLVVTNPYKNTDLQYTIPVRWTNGDWRVVFDPAATGGGWFTVTKPSPSATYQPFTKGTPQ